MNLCPFKLHCNSLELLNLLNVGDFSWSWILKGFSHVEIEKGKLFLSSYVHILHIMLLWEISCRGRAVDVKEMYQKAWYTCKAVVLVIKPIVFLCCCWRCLHSCLRSVSSLKGCVEKGSKEAPKVFFETYSTLIFQGVHETRPPMSYFTNLYEGKLNPNVWNSEKLLKGYSCKVHLFKIF